MKINISISAYLDTSNIGKVLQKHKGKNLYVHFTRYPKLGVKSTKIHADPHAIYFYPVDWVLSADNRINQHGEKQSLYQQYGLNFPYYYIVDIDKTKFGINLSDLTDEEAKRYAQVLGITVEPSRTKMPGQYLYDAIRNAASKKAFPKQIKWIEDHDGIINQHEPSQIMVRDPKLIKVIDFGETKIDSILSHYIKSIIETLGKPFSITGTKSGGKQKSITIKYKRDGFLPFTISIYEAPAFSHGYEYRCETMYPEWFISGYHKGPSVTYISEKFVADQNDSGEMLIRFIRANHIKYKYSEKLVEDGYGSDWKQENLREDITRFNGLNNHDRDYADEHNIKNKFLREYLAKEFERAQSEITDEQIEREFPLYNRDNFELFAENIKDFNEKVSRSSIRTWKNLMSMLSIERANQVRKKFIDIASEFLNGDQVSTLITDLDS